MRVLLLGGTGAMGFPLVDILFKDSLNDEIKKQIDKYGIEIYKK